MVDVPLSTGYNQWTQFEEFLEMVGDRLRTVGRQAAWTLSQPFPVLR